ncbi:MAG: Ig-like domain-containing protein, partial [Firmicutes bacterium]|nr:Ig-like domain-containing protein [Bacillota bacterium]
MNRKYTVIMLIALLAVVAVSAALILSWVRNISEDDIAGAVMEASDIDASGVAVNSSFTLNFEDAVGSAAVRRCLQVEPEIELGLHQGSSRQQVLVVPAQPLDEDTLYTFKLSMDDAAASWAFQTAADVRVASFTPEDRGSLAPDAGISFTLDRLLSADLGRISDYFSITPEISGSFEQEGRTLRFKADEDFAPGTVYHVTLKPGLPFNDTSVTLAEGVSFSFESGRSAGDWRLT